MWRKQLYNFDTKAWFYNTFANVVYNHLKDTVAQTTLHSLSWHLRVACTSYSATAVSYERKLFTKWIPGQRQHSNYFEQFEWQLKKHTFPLNLDLGFISREKTDHELINLIKLFSNNLQFCVFSIFLPYENLEYTKKK
jgi:hypothetical protein